MFVYMKLMLYFNIFKEYEDYSRILLNMLILINFMLMGFNLYIYLLI